MKTLFEKYFGIGGSSSFTEKEIEPVVYKIDTQKDLSMVAESPNQYDSKN